MNSVIEQFLTAEATTNYARELDPSGNREMLAKLEEVDHAELVGGEIGDPDMAACCKSGLWLLYNFLHESHELSQSIHTAEGSWWHAIMHRTEGDFSNAKYWYHRVGEHEAFENIEPRFEPSTFVDQCERDYRNGGLSDETQQIAFAEWKALFEYCQQNAG